MTDADFVKWSERTRKDSMDNTVGTNSLLRLIAQLLFEMSQDQVKPAGELNEGEYQTEIYCPQCGLDIDLEVQTNGSVVILGGGKEPLNPDDPPKGKDISC